MTIILDKSLIIHSLFKKINPVVKILTFAIDTSKTFFILGVKKKHLFFMCVQPAQFCVSLRQTFILKSSRMLFRTFILSFYFITSLCCGSHIGMGDRWQFHLSRRATFLLFFESLSSAYSLWTKGISIYHHNLTLVDPVEGVERGETKPLKIPFQCLRLCFKT